jgi:hypothetical protein
MLEKCLRTKHAQILGPSEFLFVIFSPSTQPKLRATPDLRDKTMPLLLRRRHIPGVCIHAKQ